MNIISPVLIVDDNRLVRRAIRNYLTGGVEICAEAGALDVAILKERFGGAQDL